MKLEIFKESKPRNANITKPIDTTYLYKVDEVDIDEDDPKSIDRAAKKLNRKLEDMDNLYVEEKK